MLQNINVGYSGPASEGFIYDFAFRLVNKPPEIVPEMIFGKFVKVAKFYIFFSEKKFWGNFFCQKMF